MALKETSPAPTRVIKLPEGSIVATFVLLLLYVITPVLLLVGRVVIANDTSPNVLVDATVNVDDIIDGVESGAVTVNTLLVLVSEIYTEVAAIVATKVTVPIETKVINPLVG